MSVKRGRALAAGCLVVLSAVSSAGAARFAPTDLARPLPPPARKLIIRVSPSMLVLAGWHVGQYVGVADAEPYLGKSTGCLSGRERRVAWPRYSAVGYIDYQADDNPCATSPPQGALVLIRFTGRWRTNRGVALGTSLSTVRRLYPASRHLRGHWWDAGVPWVHLSGQASPFNCGGEPAHIPCAQLALSIDGGRVTSLAVRLGWQYS